MITQFPCNKFVVTPSFAIKEVTIVSQYVGWTVKDYYNSESGKGYFESELFDTPCEAIAWAKNKLQSDQAKAKKAQEKLDKKADSLQKAEQKYMQQQGGKK